MGDRPRGSRLRVINFIQSFLRACALIAIVAMLPIEPWTLIANAMDASTALKNTTEGMGSAAERVKARKQGFKTRNNMYGTEAHRIFRSLYGRVAPGSARATEVSNIRNQIRSIRSEIEKLESQENIKIVSTGSPGNPESCDDIRAEANQSIIANNVQIGAEQSANNNDSFDEDNEPVNGIQNNSVVIGGE